MQTINSAGEELEVLSGTVKNSGINVDTVKCDLKFRVQHQRVVAFILKHANYFD